MEIRQEWLCAFKNYITQFAEVTDAEWSDLTDHLRPLILKKKEYFIKPGDTNIKLGFIIKGILRTFFISEDAVEYTTDFCSENEISVNYRISASGIHEDYFSQAVVESLILEIDYESYMDKGERNAKWDILQSRIIEYYYPGKIEREKSLLALSAEERYLGFLEKYSRLADRIPQYQIASYLGITPIALSRIRKKIK